MCDSVLSICRKAPNSGDGSKRFLLTVRRSGLYTRAAWVAVTFLILAGTAWPQTEREIPQVAPLAPPAEAVSAETVQPLSPEPDPETSESPDSLLTPLPEPDKQAPVSTKPEITAVTPPAAPANSGIESPSPPAPPSQAPEPVTSPQSPPNETPAAPPAPFRVDTFVLDAGHGGVDPGVTATNGTKEKEITLSLAQAIGQILLSGGKRVLYTRSDDRAMTAPQRTALAKNQRNALLISLHVGRCAENQEKTGITLVRDSGSAKNHADSSIAEALGVTDKLTTILKDKGYAVRTVSAPLRLQRAADVPVILIECGCLENEAGQRMLTDETERKTLVQSLAEAITAAGTP